MERHVIVFENYKGFISFNFILEIWEMNIKFESGKKTDVCIFIKVCKKDFKENTGFKKEIH